MDPNATLRIIRAEVGKILDENDGNSPEALAEAVRNLDGWLTNGGFSPDEWQPALSDFHDAEARHMLESEG